MPNVPAGSMRVVNSVFQGASDAFPKACHAFSSPSPKIASDFAHVKIPVHSLDWDFTFYRSRITPVVLEMQQVMPLGAFCYKMGGKAS